MGARQSSTVLVADLAVLVEFDELDEAASFYGDVGKKPGVLTADQDGDIVRLTLRVHAVTPNHLRLTKHSIVGDSTGRVFVKNGSGRYVAWRSNRLYNMLVMQSSS